MLHMFLYISNILSKVYFSKKPLLIGFSILNAGLLNRTVFDLHKNIQILLIISEFLKRFPLSFLVKGVRILSVLVLSQEKSYLLLILLRFLLISIVSSTCSLRPNSDSFYYPLRKERNDHANASGIGLPNT